MRKNEDIVAGALNTGLGNNSASLLAGLVVIPTIFALAPGAEALSVVSEGNTGLSFIWIPRLFSRLPGGVFFTVIFFLALSSAATSSLVSMTELTTRLVMDTGIKRQSSALITSIVLFLFGLPSALSIGFLDNQDWVWGVGLLVSGFFIALAALTYGVKKFRSDFINLEGNDINVGRLFDYFIYLIPVQFVLLIWWWFSKAGGWTEIFSSYSVGTCLFQWGIAITVFIIFNKWIVRQSLKEDANG